MALQETGLILDQGKAYDSNEFWIEGNLLVKYLGKSKEVTIPDVVTVIGDYAFGNATEVKTVNIPNSVVEIRDYAFRCCGVETVNNSANLEKMGKYVFNGCSCLMNIRFGGKIREIPEGTFFCCSSLKFMYLPENIKKIGNRAFGYCTKLERVAAFSGLSSIIISDDAFMECGNLIR